MNAIVLCGGKGIRLRPLTLYIQKTMLPFGPEERPVLEHVIRHLVQHSVDRVILSLDYKGHQIHNYFRDGSDFGVELVYVWRGTLKGTGNGVVEALEHVASTDVIIYYGDTISSLDISKMHAFHQDSHAAITVATLPSLPTDFGLLELEGDVIRGFVEKPMIERPANLGVYIMKASLRSALERMCKDSERDFSKDVVSYVLDAGYHVAAFITDDPWCSIDNLGQYETLKESMEDSTLADMLGMD